MHKSNLNIKLVNIFFYSYFLLSLYRVNILIAAIPYIIFIIIVITNWRGLTNKIILGRYYDYPIFLYILLIPILYNSISLLLNQYGIFEYGRVLATTMPALVVLIINPRNLQKINIIKPFILFGFLAATSIYYQYVYGAIEWFASDSMRGGFNRYASLAGNLNSYPIGLGGLLLLYINQHKKKGINIYNIFGFIFLAFAGLLTLSKIAVLNIIMVLAIMYIFYFHSKNIFKYVYKLLYIIPPILILAYCLKDEVAVSNFLELILSFIGLGSPKILDYHAPIDDVVFRLTDLPDFSSFGIFGLLFGGGLIAFGSAIGASGIFYHNDYINYISACGILGLILLLYAIIRPIKNSTDIAGLSVILLINLLFGSGILFHFYEGYALIVILYFARCVFVERLNAKSDYLW